MEQRTFKLDGQWNMVYYPFRPSGFAVLIIGDRGHYVDEETSYWLQHPGRLSIIDHLKDTGYTLFSSNLYGAHWGSKKSADFCDKLYLLFMKSEIVNPKIHILAEGMGVLTAIRLMKAMPDRFRSAVWINPVLSLKGKMDKEKENKFFYKKWLAEAAAAYEMIPETCEELLGAEQKVPLLPKVPIKIIHVLERHDDKQYALYRDLEKQGNACVDIAYLLPEKRYKIPQQIQQFFKQHEAPL